MHTSNRWTFLSNHAHVLLCVAKDPDLRLREIAERVGITERAVQRIVTDLAEGGYIAIRKEGRRNHYDVQADRHLCHPVEHTATISDLLILVSGPG